MITGGSVLLDNDGLSPSGDTLGVTCDPVNDHIRTLTGDCLHSHGRLLASGSSHGHIIYVRRT